MFWNVLGNLLNPDYKAFWEKDGPLWLSAVLMCASMIMVMSNLIVRQRDALDELGEISLLPRALFKVGRPSHGQIVSFMRRNWIFFGFLLVFVVAHSLTSLYWLLIVAGVLLVVVVVAIVGKALFEYLKNWHFANSDRSEVQNFERHFSGMRSEIQAALDSVRTDSARIAILASADNRAQELLAKLADEDNVWVGGQRPKYGGAVDGYLAMLDERWWGL